MYLLTLPPKQAGFLLSFLISLPLQVLSLALERRVGNDDTCPDEAPTSDGPTSDNSAGIGVEFEAGGIRFSPKEEDKCSLEQTRKSKGILIDNRKGTNWELTGDSPGTKGILNAEYILDGTKIKIGNGTAVKAASEVADNIASWDPSAKDEHEYNIPGSDCNPWKISRPAEKGSADQVKWAPQITVPIPLEAISDLFSKALSSDQESPLLGSLEFRPIPKMVHVTKKFFQSKPNDISSDDVKDDVLGFFSLLLTYAKGAKELDGEQSAKHLGSIMPRTEFTTTFKQVDSSVPGTLYDIVKVLACYKNDGDDVKLDTYFCSGTEADPEPNGEFDKQTFLYEPDVGDPDELKVKDWIESIDNGDSPDKLTAFDKKHFHGQVGGLKQNLEKVVDGDREVPLFEFRRLVGVTSDGMKEFVDKAEQEVIRYHKADSTRPRFVRRRLDGRWIHMKRGNGTSCAMPSGSGSASLGTALPTKA